jgi:hypothetical protein
MAGIVEEATIGGASLVADIGRQRGQQLPKARRGVGFHRRLKLLTESVRVDH